MSDPGKGRRFLSASGLGFIIGGLVGGFLTFYLAGAGAPVGAIIGASIGAIISGGIETIVLFNEGNTRQTSTAQTSVEKTKANTTSEPTTRTVESTLPATPVIPIRPAETTNQTTTVKPQASKSLPINSSQLSSRNSLFQPASNPPPKNGFNVLKRLFGKTNSI